MQMNVTILDSYIKPAIDQVDLRPWKLLYFIDDNYVELQKHHPHAYYKANSRTFKVKLVDPDGRQKIQDWIYENFRRSRMSKAERLEQLREAKEHREYVGHGSYDRTPLNVPPFIVLRTYPRGKDPVYDQLDRWLERSGAPWIVRSSASCEDGSNTSFAGLFESYPNLTTPEEVEEAVKKVYQSKRAERVVEYCKNHGIDHTKIEMEVIVQKMIEPQLSGVVFSRNPVTGEAEAVIEAVEGLADGLMNGEVDPLPSDHKLIQLNLDRLKKLAYAAENIFYSAQDIEFAIDKNNKLWIVQARPITALA